MHIPPNESTFTLSVQDGPDVSGVLRRLDSEAIFAQLLGRAGRMAELANEGGDVKLAWIDGVAKALAHPEWIDAVADEAAAILERGIRRIIWAGMGGSVQAVYCLKRMGLLEGAGISIHPLDSTDPASLNRTIAELAAAEKITLLSGDVEHLKTVFEATMMVGVSMGMTSEEPITHLEWFARLLDEARVADPASHVQVMTLPGSYLDDFARQRGSVTVPIQLDGESHTPGRMSAPATRVFLRPLALVLAAGNGRDRARTAESLRAILRRAQFLGGIEAERDVPSENLFVKLGAIIAQFTEFEGRNKVILDFPSGWRGFGPWLEQLVEESLGKGGKGFLVFSDQDNAGLQDHADVMALRLNVSIARTETTQAGARAPGATIGVQVDPATMPLGAAETAGLMLGFSLTVATFGYLHSIVFAGQPAVEAYKRYARELRESPEPVAMPTPHDLQATNRDVTVDAGSLVRARLASVRDLDRLCAARGWDITTPSGLLAAVLALAKVGGWFRYLDLTYNGEMTEAISRVMEAGRDHIARTALGIPCKLRTGPSDYHSTEQGETDGPFELVSIRVLALRHDEPIVGVYTDKFLLAQARGTWQAMEDAGRWVVMVMVPDTSNRSMDALVSVFSETASLLMQEA